MELKTHRIVMWSKQNTMFATVKSLARDDARASAVAIATKHTRLSIRINLRANDAAISPCENHHVPKESVLSKVLEAAKQHKYRQRSKVLQTAPARAKLLISHALSIVHQNSQKCNRGASNEEQNDNEDGLNLSVFIAVAV